MKIYELILNSIVNTLYAKLYYFIKKNLFPLQIAKCKAADANILFIDKGYFPCFNAINTAH
jgi:hypothetical protein